MGTYRYIDEFVDYIHSYVNPHELSAPSGFFRSLCEGLDKTCVLVRLAVAKDEYDKETAERKVRPQPDTTRHYKKLDWERAQKRNEEIREMDVVFRNTRKKCMDELAGKNGGKSKALDVFTEWERGAVRFFYFFQKTERHVLRDPEGRLHRHWPSISLIWGVVGRR